MREELDRFGAWCFAIRSAVGKLVLTGGPCLASGSAAIQQGQRRTGSGTADVEGDKKVGPDCVTGRPWLGVGASCVRTA